jgi:hypothetical protein
MPYSSKSDTMHRPVLRYVAAALFGIATLLLASWSALTGYFMFACHHSNWNFDSSGGPFWGWFWDAAGWALFALIIAPVAFKLATVLAVVTSVWLYFFVAPFSSWTRFILVAIVSSAISVALLPLAYWIAYLTNAYSRCSLGF